MFMSLMLFLAIEPNHMAGTWQGKIYLEDSTIQVSVTFRVDDEKLRGNISIHGASKTIERAVQCQIKDEQLTMFVPTLRDKPFYDGVIRDNVYVGHVTFGEGAKFPFRFEQIDPVE